MAFLWKRFRLGARHRWRRLWAPRDRLLAGPRLTNPQHQVIHFLWRFEEPVKAEQVANNLDGKPPLGLTNRVLHSLVERGWLTRIHDQHGEAWELTPEARARLNHLWMNAD